MASAGPALTLARHRVAVQTGHHRGRLAGNVDQDRGRRSAVLRAVVDAGQHDQRGNRRQRERHRQQHCDRRDRADAGQHADQRAQQDADEAIQQVRKRQRDGETDMQVGEKIHLEGQQFERQAEAVSENADRKPEQHAGQHE